MSFADAGRKIIEGAAAGLYEAGTIIMAQSQMLVPVETGTLKRSGRVEEPVIDGDKVTVTVGYGYGGTEEDPQYGYWVEYREYTRRGEKVKHAPPTQAHYLSQPARQMEPELGAILEHNIDAKLNS